VCSGEDDTPDERDESRDGWDDRTDWLDTWDALADGPELWQICTVCLSEPVRNVAAEKSSSINWLDEDSCLGLSGEELSSPGLDAGGFEVEADKAGEESDNAKFDSACLVGL